VLLEAGTVPCVGRNGGGELGHTLAMQRDGATWHMDDTPGGTPAASFSWDGHMFWTLARENAALLHRLSR
jgi:hypothetical protein